MLFHTLDRGVRRAQRPLLTSSYDTLSHRTGPSATVGGTADFTNAYQLDALHRMTRVEQTGTGVAEKRVDFAYNQSGQYTQIARYKDTDGGSTHEVATSAFSYDTVGRLTGLTHHRQSTDLVGPYSWTYDALNRADTFTLSGNTADYGYDAASQLTSNNNSSTLADEGYGYDNSNSRRSRIPPERAVFWRAFRKRAAEQSFR